MLGPAFTAEVPIKVDKQLRRAATPTVDRLPVITNRHQANHTAMLRLRALHSLHPLHDLRRDILKFVNQQMAKRCQQLCWDALPIGIKARGQLLERSIEGQ